MQRTELIAKVAKETGVSQAVAAKVVNRALEVIEEALSSGDRVTLTGFGTFEVRETAARTGTNPRTGQKLKIPAGKRVTFRSGTALRDVVSGK
ncbi:MAG: HU family DNA-binding protein [Anaerolineae bacterium]|nr:HU family DNA-binding protein [Anaerolineae bacterium]